ncbi:RluA family pseudouridine synthase [Bacillus weihaiensis]|uniref:RluA family pseudouridine synthase n=1 Tax=Bacillus weihaiensis TaxID=1547283 RepID=UPI00235768EC|nr:RluA family pseudouridine synthase [Bacillus weihaiensis]
MKSFQLNWVIDAYDSGKLVVNFLKEKQLSKRALTDIKFHGGDIRINDEHVTVRYKLKEHDLLTVIFPEEDRGASLEGDPYVPYSIVYEDDHCLVINKPANVPSIPSRDHPSGTLANGLIYYYEQRNIPSTIHIVNRLDKDTSGLMLVAKHRFAHSLFSTQQKKKQIHRSYEAIVHGAVRLSEGTISKKIGRKSDSIIERVVTEDGQEAITHYKVLSTSKELSHIKLVLDTGRTHQIRVHMASIGHPLCGDSLYGGRMDHIQRQALHSSELTFFHPILLKELSFSLPLPKDMKSMLK